MKFKLDENFGVRTIGAFRRRGLNVATVRDEELTGCADEKLFRICAEEQRCLVTLDLDFADILRFPPRDSAGIAVLRLPKNPTLPMLESMIGRFLDALGSEPMSGQLWIVETSRIRVHADPDVG